MESQRVMKPKVKPSEKSRVLSTRDYSLFEFPDVNISKRYLGVVTDSIKEKDLTPDFPVLVDDKYHIIDGKYRFLACYNLRLAIHYKIAEVTTIQDATRIKEILRKTPYNEIIKIYIEKHQYRDVSLMQKEFDNFFNLRDIFVVICRKYPDTPINKTYGYSIHLIPDRYKIASGKLQPWDYTKTFEALTKAKTLISKYHWSKTGALKFVSHNDTRDIDISENIELIKKCERAFNKSGCGDEFSNWVAFHAEDGEVYYEYLMSGSDLSYEEYINELVVKQQ